MKGNSYRYFKRFIDISGAGIFLLLLSPIFLFVPIIIRVSMGNPVFFRQIRIGKDNKEFSIVKFRTMSNHGGTDQQRVTKLGAVLRKLSIDEFPQLVNILKGDMSFIGPRPLLPEYLPYYNERELLRHTVRPGMSGLAQVSGRNYLTWDEQFELDAVYAENLSLPLDLKIFIKTIPKVLGSADTMVTGRKDKEKFDVIRKRKLKDIDHG